MQKLIDNLKKVGVEVEKLSSIEGIKVIVPLSGGKDSQTCLELALKEYKNSEILALFCDTKFEHDITYKHIEGLISKYRVNYVYLNAGSVLSVCTKYKRFPGGGARHCTDELKIRPTKFFLKEFSLLNEGTVEVWYGMRMQESPQRAKRYAGKLDGTLYAPHEVMPRKYPKYLEKQGVMFKLPILEWSEEEVYTFLRGRGNPLYEKGFDRVGCFPCLAGGEKLQLKAFEFDEVGAKHYQVAVEISEIAKRPVFQGKKLKGVVPQCSICSM